MKLTLYNVIALLQLGSAEMRYVDIELVPAGISPIAMFFRQMVPVQCGFVRGESLNLPSL